MQQAINIRQNSSDLRNQTVSFCQKLIAGVLKVSSEKISPAATFDTYGIDSILIGQIYVKLKDQVGDIDNTVMFSCHSIDDLADYLVGNKAQQLKSLLKVKTENRKKGISPKEIPFFIPKINPRKHNSAPNKQAIASGQVDLSSTMERKIAIIGIDGAYPGAKNLNEFWNNLASAKNCITEVPEDRWNLNDFYEPNRSEALQQGKSYCKWGGFLDNFSEFDPGFFGISEDEAWCIDPQERIFLQSAWKALESSGHTLADLKKKYSQKVGVFVGITKLGFNLYGSSETIRSRRFFPRTSFSSVANRLSYFLNATGPSMPIDTMCSSSLTAIHEACVNIKNGTCSLALAGGVNLYLHPYTYVDLSAQGMLSANGRLCSFGADADGFVPGEGVGVVVLKDLEHALNDRDNVLGVILSTQINHSGRSNGYTLPNPKSYAELIRDAINRAAITPDDIGYIEAHGTGTLIGDSIEIAALREVFADRHGQTKCKLGSVKSNIGHCESAAGISAVTKVLLQFQNRQIAPSINADRLNPHINLSASHFDLNSELCDWSETAGKRIAGVSSFGAGGANAHIILQEFNDKTDLNKHLKAGNALLFPFSARTETQLHWRVQDMLEYLNSMPPEFSDHTLLLRNLAYTLQVGREQMVKRVGFIAETVSALKQQMENFLAEIFSQKSIERVSTPMDREGIVAALATGDLASLLNFWLANNSIEWSELYESQDASSKPKRIALPTYPFLKKSYWITNLPENTGMPESVKNSNDGANSNGNDVNDALNIVVRVRQEVSNILGVSLSSVDEKTNLIELGMDSIGLIKLLERLSNVVGIKIGPELFFTYPDISSLASYLASASSVALDGSVSANDVQTARLVDSRQSNTRQANARQLNSDRFNVDRFVVSMRTAGGKTPFFVIPGGPGNVLAMLPLSQALGDEQPFYCLQPDVDLSESEFKGMARVIAYFSEAITSVGKGCPVKLIGYSNGGVVAYELTRQLQLSGIQVEQLVLVDTLCPLNQKRDLLDETVDIAEKFMLSLGASISVDRNAFKTLGDEQRCEYLYKLMTDNGLDLDEVQFGNAYRHARASDECCRNYQPHKLPNHLPVVLFRAKEAYPQEQSDYGWGALLDSSLKTININANHFTILNEEAVQELAKYLH